MQKGLSKGKDCGNLVFMDSVSLSLRRFLGKALRTYFQEKVREFFYSLHQGRRMEDLRCLLRCDVVLFWNGVFLRSSLVNGRVRFQTKQPESMEFNPNAKV